MKSLAVILLVFVSASFGAIVPDFLTYKEGQRFFLLPGRDGQLQLIDLQAEDPENRYNPEADIVFRLYTRDNPTTPQIVTFGDANSLANSNFDVNKDTKFFSHGWNNVGESYPCFLIRDRFLALYDVNIICVDWGVGANTLYLTAVNNVPPTGVMVGRFIDWLVEQGSSINSFHVTGFSLGGHIAGVTGRSVNSGTIPYITSIDPAGPLWGPESQRIRPSDGGYVEVIHTNTIYLGLEDPVGHNDFYPNGGRTMPGCGVLDSSCSHARAFEYFAYSLGNTGFMSNQCEDYSEIANGVCSNLSQLHMGGSQIKEARGIFWLATSDAPPFYLG